MATSKAPAAAANSKKLPQIVVVGGGFAGVAAVRALRKCEAEITLIDRRNHHIFQPLLYQVATAVLSAAEVAAPIRQLAARQRNLDVLLAEVRRIDVEGRAVDAQLPDGSVRRLPFDYL